MQRGKIRFRSKNYFEKKVH